ncbi:hypothetical protein CQW23_08404 [Capsicum baccatum]|uniref:KIB1-4 beta-propeller domain-containing protein n=1 Tax=Capsicum baccatum TaxID=33114 RepID=A0A2G2X8U4_CAPBA|nr:hypothetical protein CQW23_08404 [Capsicum baccatum]
MTVKVVCYIPSLAFRLNCPIKIPLKIIFTRRLTCRCTFSIKQLVLSSSPSHTSNYVLMVIEGVHDVARPQPATNVIAQLQFHCLDRQGQLYILESLGSLFVVVRHGVQPRYVEDDGDRIPLTYIRMEGEEKDQIYGTTNFRVFQVDLAAGKVTETRELGDTTFFIGNNASLSVQASQFSGIKSNHIYFTDDFWETHLFYQEGGGLDMGVFSLADGSIQPHYKGLSLGNICPLIWVTPTLY